MPELFSNMTHARRSDFSHILHHTWSSTTMTVGAEATGPANSAIMSVSQSSSQQPQSSPQQSVFDLPELFEMVLTNLNPRDIIRAAGTNKTGRGLLSCPSL